MFSNQSELIAKSNENKTHEEGRVQVLRRENDKLRKELGQSIDEKLKLLISIKEQQRITLGDQRSMSHILSKSFIHSMLFLFQQLQNLYQYSKSMQIIQQKQKLNENTNKQKEELQRMKLILKQKEQMMQRLVEVIDEKTKEYERVGREVQRAVGECNELKRKLVEKKWGDGVGEIIASQLDQNWQQQAATITLLIEQRQTLRRQFSLLDRANQLLIQKIITLTRQFQNSLHRNVKIHQLKIKNQQLILKLSQQKSRKNRLQQSREVHVHNMSVRLAADVAEKWDGEKRGCENLLLRIIEKVNDKLPFRKIDDVGEIIRAAENFFQPQMESHRQNNHSSISNQNDQLQQI